MNHPALTEEAYVRDLEGGRRLFAWCFVNIGSRTEQQAWQAALEFYKYEPPEKEFRWLVFHEEAWCWAMQRLFGLDYYLTRPELAVPSAEYENEARRDAWESPSTTAPDASAR